VSSQQRRLARRQKRQSGPPRPALHVSPSEQGELNAQLRNFLSQGQAGPQGEVELAHEGDSLTLPEDATLEEIEATLAKLRGLLHRVEQQRLEPDDWPLLRALLVREAM
jgi:hypothetical protein